MRRPRVAACGPFPRRCGLQANVGRARPAQRWSTCPPEALTDEAGVHLVLRDSDSGVGPRRDGLPLSRIRIRCCTSRLSGELAEQPVSRWIAPEWRGAWNQEGLFREHPVGILLPSVLLIRAGVPAGQAAYIVNMLYQAAVIALIPLVAGAVVKGFEARTLAWVLQLLPVSFAYRIRGNQEHPLLMCFLALVYGTERARTSPAWALLMVVSFCGLVLVKGAFAMFALVGAALWLLVIPAPRGASNRWSWMGLVAAAAAAALMMAAYETVYVRTTGESFLDFYGSTRLGQSIQLGDPRLVPHALTNVGWYLLRLGWFAAPWSLVAFVVACDLATGSRTGANGGGLRGRECPGNRVGAVDDGRVHCRPQPGARARRAVHFSRLFHHGQRRRGGSHPRRAKRPPSRRPRRRVPLAPRLGLDGDIPAQLGEQPRQALSGRGHPTVTVPGDTQG